MGRVVNRPGLLAYIRETGPVQAIFTLLSLSSLCLLSSLFENPSPNLVQSYPEIQESWLNHS